jgi:predicted outer membrane repeat protein
VLRRLLDRLPAPFTLPRPAHAPGAPAGRDSLLGQTLDRLFRRRPLVEELEPRLLFSADLAPVVLDGLQPAPEQRVLDAAGEYAHSATTLRRELAIVDSRVDGYQALLDDILAQADGSRRIEVVVLDPARDGIEQIGEALKSRGLLDAVHLLSHGDAGSLQLGSTTLDAVSLDARANDIAAWGLALNADADLLLYGCKVADGAKGEIFLDTLGRLTGADVAASDDLTGSADRGGDWLLEYRRGEIDTGLAISAAWQQGWSGALASIAVTTTDDVLDGDTSSLAALLGNRGADGNISLREAIIAANNTVGADTVVLGSGTYSLTRAGSSEDAGVTGDLDIADALTITGTGAGDTIIDGQWLDRVFDIRAADAVLTDLTVRNGLVTTIPWGGGLYMENNTVNLTRVVFENNTAMGGGAIYNYHGTLNLTESTLQGNSAVSWGGALYNDGGTAMLASSTLNGNMADDGGGIYSAGNNAGTPAHVSLHQVTLSGNSAGDGGAIYTTKAVDIAFSTLAFNTALDGGGIYLSGGGSAANLDSSILAHNTGGNASGPLTSLGHNLDDDGTAGLTGAGDLNGIDPLLAALADNGGPTWTHALLDGSLAINAGSALAPVMDQRGAFRDGQADIGAYEYNGVLNTAPVNTLPGTAPAITEDQTTAIAGLSVADANESGGVAAYRLETVQLSVSHGSLNVTLAGAATVAAGANGGATLTLSGSEADLNATLATLTYTGEADFAGSDTLVMSSHDDAGLADTDSLALTVTAANDAPVVASPIPDQSATEDVPFSFTFSANTFADVDAGDTLSYSVGSLPGWLTFDAGTRTFSGTPGDGDTGAVTVTVTATDAAGASTSDSFILTVAPVNDAPAITLPAPQVTAPGTTLTLSAERGNGISVSDIDAEFNLVEVTLTALPGSLTLSETGDLSFSVGDGTLDGSMTFTGTLADVNDALDGLKFIPQAGYTGWASIEISINDLGHTGGTPLTASATLGIEVSNDLRVNTVTANTQSEPSVAMDAAGNYVVVWTSDGQDGGGKGVYAQRFDATATPQGAAFRVNTTIAGDQKAANVAMAPDGSFVVAWTSADGSNNGIYAQRYDATGVAMGGEFRVNTTTPRDQISPSVAMASDGGFVVVWTSDSGSSRFDVMAQRYDASGVAAGSEFRVNTTVDKNQIEPVVAMGPGGSFIVAWTSTNAIDGSGKGVFAQRFAGDGTALGSEFQVNTTSAGNQDRPALAIRSGGTFVIAWTSDDGLDGDKSGIFAQRYAADGTALGGEFQVNSHTSESQSRPAMAFDATGELVVVWQSNDQDGDKNGIFAQRYDDNGAPIGQEYRINGTASGEQIQPAVAAGPSGYHVVAWQGNGPGDSAGIFHRITPAPNDGPVITMPGALSTPEDTPLVLSAANGNRVSLADPDAGLAALSVTLSVSEGSLTLADTHGLLFTLGDGSGDGSMAFTGKLADINLALDGLRFDPLPNAHGPVSLTIGVNDLGNTGSGGAKSASTSVAITVTDVNDVPQVSGAVDLGTLLEDSARLITEAELLAHASDADGDALAISGLVVASGSGTLADHGDGSWTFNPDANWHGSVTFAYEIGDGSTTVPGSATLTVSPVSDAPTGTDATVVINEGATHVFQVADFGFSDAADAPADTLLAVKITSLPAAGQLRYEGSPVAEGQVIGAADISLNELEYIAPATAPAAGYTKFTFQVIDSGSTIDGGVDMDPVPRTLTINFALVNVAPTATGTAFLAAIEEDEANPAGATVADLFAANFSNPEDEGTPVHSAFAGVAVRGQSVNPAQGRWQYSTDHGATWQNFGFISDANAISLGLDDRLRFLPAADYHGTPNNLSVRLLDNSVAVTGGGTIDASLNGGTSAVSSGVVPLSTAVDPVNDVPVAAPVDLGAMPEDGSRLITTAELLAGSSDVDGDMLNASGLVIASGSGTLTDHGDGTWTFTPDADWHGSVTLAYEVGDGSVTVPGSASLMVDPVNDAPAFTSGGSAEADEDQPAGTRVTASDVEGDTLTFSISGGADAALFSIDPANGELKLVVTPDYEAPLDANRDNVYEVVVTASDGKGGSAAQTVKLVVLDVAEPLVPPTDPAPETPPGEDDAPDDSDETGSDGTGLLEGGAGADILPPTQEGSAGEDATGLSTFAGDERAGSASAALRPVLDALGNLVREARDPALASLQASLSKALEGLAGDARALQALQTSLESGDFQQQLNELQNEMRQMLRLDDGVVTSSLAVSTSLSVGYVLWLVRGGVLLSSLLSTLPAWQLMDPLPVLGHLRDRKDKDDHDDSLEGILKKSRARPRPDPQTRNESPT